MPILPWHSLFGRKNARPPGRPRPGRPPQVEALEARALLTGQIPAVNLRDSDLVITHVPASLTATVGGEINVAWAVRNQGKDFSAGRWIDEVSSSFFRGRGDFEHTIADIRPGEEYHAGGSWDVSPYASPGHYNLTLVIGSGAIETNKDNNTAVIPVTLIDSPVDLRIFADSVPASAVAGARFHVLWGEAGGGNVAGRAFASHVYLSDDAALDPGKDVLLGISFSHPIDPQFGYHERAEVVISPSSAAGTKYLIFQVDTVGADGQLDPNPANNVVAVPIRIARPAPVRDLSAVAATPTAAPITAGTVINDGSAQRSMVKSVTLTFGAAVTLDAGAVRLTRDGALVAGVDIAVSLVGGKTVAVLTFHGNDAVGGSLADGRYALTVVAAKVRGLAGSSLAGDFVTNFHRLFGDTDGDGRVDGWDLDRFVRAMDRRRGQPGYQWSLDAGDDGTVDRTTDYVRFLRNYGRRV